MAKKKRKPPARKKAPAPTKRPGFPNKPKTMVADAAARGRYGDTSHNVKGRFAGGMSTVKVPQGTKNCGSYKGM